MRLPNLDVESEKLNELYSNHLRVSAKTIRTCFGVSPRTAGKVMKILRDYCHENDIKIYGSEERLLDTNILFEVYGWDIDEIRRRLKYKRRSS